MNILQNFINFESKQSKSIRGGVEMYDIKGYYKYLTFSELFDYWCSRSNCTQRFAAMLSCGLKERNF
jgi:hypothetical protein